MSSTGLELVNKQCRIAWPKFMTGKNTLPDYMDLATTTVLQFSIELESHAIIRFQKSLNSSTLVLLKWEAHALARNYENRHLRISIPTDTLTQRSSSGIGGKPKNTTEAVPASLAIARSSQTASRRSTEGEVDQQGK